MCDSNISKARRITAGIMGLMMLAIVLFSAFFITFEADHDCCGEDCPVCSCIQYCENTLRCVVGRASMQLSFIIPVILVLFIAFVPEDVLFQDTLVSRKIRLNN